MNSNEAVTKPVVPTREDYRFSNWYTEKEYENIYDFTSPVTKDFTLYAKWESTLSTEFTLSEENTSVNVGEEHTLNITLAPGADPSKYDITWDIKDDTKLEQISVSINKLEFKFKGKTETEELSPSEITVEVKAKGGSSSNTKSCFVTVNKVLTDKEKFLKDYKTYSDNFQNSEKIYDAADISIKVDEQDPTTVSEISYENKTESTSRHCVINDQYPIAGGSYEYSALKTQLDNYEAQAATFEYTKENNIVAISVFFGNILFLRYKFNSNGYLTEYGMMGELKFKTTTYIYSKEPREKTEQEKFYDVYKLASKNFQKATKEYTTSTIKCKIDGVEKEVVTVSYQTDDGVRKCVFQAKDQQMTFIIAGGDLCYFDDVTKGIKNTISYLETQLTKTATYSSNKETGECSFRVGTMSATFNKNGYITLHDTNSMNERVEYTYID